MVRRPLRPVVRVKVDEPTKGDSPISIPLEIGLLTSASFVATGTLNAIRFEREWGLDYFSIATPTDIVMGGFSVGLSFLTAALVLAFAAAFMGPPVTWLWRKITGKPFFGSFEKRIVSRMGVRWILIGVFVLNVGAEAITVARAPLPVIGFTGLFVADDAEVSETCQGGIVRWMGSSAAVIECDRTIRVIRSFDSIEFLTIKNVGLMSDRPEPVVSPRPLGPPPKAGAVN